MSQSKNDYDSAIDDSAVATVLAQGHPKASPPPTAWNQKNRTKMGQATDGCLSGSSSGRM